MDFKKIYERVVSVDIDSYFSIQKYAFVESVDDGGSVLRNFMKSKYFLWQEEYRNKVHVCIDGNNVFVDWNFHGLYDIKKLSPSDFTKVNFDFFKHRFINFMEGKIDTDDKLPEIIQVMSEINEPESASYIINDLPNTKIHKWTVFEFFISGIVINIPNKTIVIIEFGED